MNSTRKPWSAARFRDCISSAKLSMSLDNWVATTFNGRGLPELLQAGRFRVSEPVDRGHEFVASQKAWIQNCYTARRSELWPARGSFLLRPPWLPLCRVENLLRK